MRKALVSAFLLSLFAHPGCTCANNPGGLGDGGRSDGGAFSNGLNVTPPEATVDVTAGGPPGTTSYQAFTTTGNKDVTGQSAWSIGDATLGSIAGGKFTASGAHGGTTQVLAQYNNLSGGALLHVKLHATVNANCPSCPTFPASLPGPACAAGTAPTLIYPPDGVLVPPNMNVMEVQFQPGTGTLYYEIDFENAATDVRVVTGCNPVSDTRGVATGGCAYALDPTVWNYVANSNRGGDPVQVSVRATTDGSCASPSAMRNVSFAEQDINGGLYYWQSLVVGGVAGKAGGIFRFDWGNPGALGQPFLTPATGSCVGCHFLSRDGTRMTYGSDDADSDDEYADLSGHLLDVAAKAPIATTTPGIGKPLPPGFQTFTHDNQRVMASTGQANSTSFNVWNGLTGGAPVGMMSTGMRGTQPDWSADDQSVVFVVPTRFANKFTPALSNFNKLDDDHFVGGSLFTASYNATAGTFGAPVPLVQSMGENNYYPSYSPDTPSTWVVFNRVDDPAANTDLLQDAFNNPYARVWLLSTKMGATPFVLGNLNGEPKSTNSWPRWSPFVQMYRGQRLLWVTFSSTRDYGIRVRNHTKVPDGTGATVDQVDCYPPDSPQNQCPPGVNCHGTPFAPNCNQPQIWMAAINLSAAEFANDPSFPAFWLPFQDVTAHNHIAQWTQAVVQSGCGDGGVPLDGSSCIGVGQPCGSAVCGTCCGGAICSGGTCNMVIP